MKRKDREWYSMLLKDPKLRREWLRFVKKNKQKEVNDDNA